MKATRYFVYGIDKILYSGQYRESSLVYCKNENKKMKGSKKESFDIKNRKLKSYEEAD
jgi:hypothetical protein